MAYRDNRKVQSEWSCDDLLASALTRILVDPRNSPWRPPPRDKSCNALSYPSYNLLGELMISSWPYCCKLDIMGLG